MATRSKKFKYSVWLKIILIVFAIIGIIQGVYLIPEIKDMEYAFQSSDYGQSRLLESTIEEVYYKVDNFYNLLISEENIRAEGWKKDAYNNTVEWTVQSWQNDRDNTIDGVNNRYRELLKGEEDDDTRNQLIKERSEEIQSINSDYEKRIEDFKQSSIDGKIYTYRTIKDELANLNGICYCVTKGETVQGKTLEFYKALPYYKGFTSRFSTVEMPIEIYVGITQDEFDKRKVDYYSKHQNGIKILKKLASSLFLVIISLIWLGFTAGRRASDEEVRLNLLDKIYLDIGLICTFSVSALCFMAIYGMVNQLYDNGFNNGLILITIIILLCTIYFSIALYISSLSKRLKRGETMRHTLICWLFMAIYKSIKRLIGLIIYALNPNFRLFKLVIIFGVYFLAVVFDVILMFIVGYAVGAEFAFFLTGLIFIAINVFAVYLAHRWMKGLEVLFNGIKKIQTGDYNEVIPVTNIKLIDSASADINNIADGLKLAVDKKVKAEQMKVELITNVSHDLKTPLTSIISYVDLLSKEPLEGKLRDYTEVLRAKSEKLKYLVEDLFEVSKAQSGNIEVQRQQLCLNDLIKQVFAEYENGFNEQRLNLKVNTGDEKIMILADSSRMWRVLSNIFSNIVKYSLSGTRVYIDAQKAERTIRVIFKNISNYEMNFVAEDMTNRFTRGDESRSSNGTGLGLAIVSSFMSLQGGSCAVEVDGDLFKVNLTIPIAES